MNKNATTRINPKTLNVSFKIVTVFNCCCHLSQTLDFSDSSRTLKILIYKITGLLRWASN